VIGVTLTRSGKFTGKKIHSATEPSFVFELVTVKPPVNPALGRVGLRALGADGHVFLENVTTSDGTPASLHLIRTHELARYGWKDLTVDDKLNAAVGQLGLLAAAGNGGTPKVVTTGPEKESLDAIAPLVMLEVRPVEIQEPALA